MYQNLKSWDKYSLGGIIIFHTLDHLVKCFIHVETESQGGSVSTAYHPAI